MYKIFKTMDNIMIIIYHDYKVVLYYLRIDFKKHISKILIGDLERGNALCDNPSFTQTLPFPRP